MAGFVPIAPLLSPEEIERLTATQLATLREEIQKEIRTSGAIQEILKRRARQVYDQLTSSPTSAG
jgi:hypothetical protein